MITIKIIGTHTFEPAIDNAKKSFVLVPLDERVSAISNDSRLYYIDQRSANKMILMLWGAAEPIRRMLKIAMEYIG